MRIRDLKIEMVAVSALRPSRRNARTHSRNQIRQIASSIKTFAWTNPILADADGGIIAGEGRFEAAKLLKLDCVPIVRIADMTPAQRRAYALADNKLAANAGWDPEILTLELQGLLEIELDFDVTVTGFEMGEIDALIGQSEKSGDDADTLPTIAVNDSPVAQAGDLWLLDRHRLYCADSTQTNSFERLMAGERAGMAFTDPPYNLPIDGFVSGLGIRKHSDFVMAVGEMSVAEFIEFLDRVLRQMAARSRNGAIHFVCMDWRHLYELLTVAREVYGGVENLCVWNKTNAGLGNLYRSQHELVGVFKVGSAPHVNNVELGRYGRNRTNVWTYPGMNSFSAERDQMLKAHPTVKPVKLVEDAILDCSHRGDIILDAFVGAGTTLIAAHRVGRRGFGIEIEPKYVDVTLKRFHAATGIEPLHEDSGLTFANLERARNRSDDAQPTESER